VYYEAVYICSRILVYGPSHPSTAQQEYVGDSVKGYEAGDDSEAWAVEEGIPI